MTKLMTSVKGLRVLIAGGASGLGAATARHLINGGAKVLIVDAVDSAAAKTPPPKAAIYHRADVTSEEEVASAISLAAREFHGLDAVVNCAAMGFAARTYNWNLDTTFSSADFFKALQVNTAGTFNVCRLAAQLMAKNAPRGVNDADAGGDKSGAASAGTVCRGVIVNTASLSAFDGMALQVSYSANKAAVAAMTLPLARDLAPIGIRVCAIAPGNFDSPMSRRESFPPDLVKYLSDQNRAIYRLGRPEEFAHAVETILLNPMLNGVNIRLDAASRGFFFNRRQKAQPKVSLQASGAAAAAAV